MKEKKTEANKVEDEIEMEVEGEQEAVNKSPIADPILSGKLLERCLKLVKKVQEYEKEERKEKTDKKVRYVRRGVHEVTKSIRKGQKGLVLIACDIHPVDIIAHIPILCEEKNIYYGYLGSKKTLGMICKSKRPASVLMISFNNEKSIQDKPFYSIYNKVISSIKKIHPYI
ncbi:putative 60S ribosomal protein L7a [Cryptosporidium felis]|nr:putative 60S ribosomal protein L7a [Cryptosporidium felis]